MSDSSLALQIKSLPEKPGVYQYYDKDGGILYVGKAKNLKKRVGSYFNKNHDNGKTRILVKKICSIETIVVETEMDALLLENNLIKKYQPRYNIQLKDDKTYPWICIKKEAFPRVFSTRKLIKDGSKYFGPYSHGKVVQTLLDLFREMYPLRTCHLDLSANKIEENKYKVCLEYHIGKCKAPCTGLESSEQYQIYISEIEQILMGQIKPLVKGLKKEMLDCAERYAYEDANRIKGRIAVLEKYQAKSTVVSPTVKACDVITVKHDELSAYVNYLVIKDGAIIHGYTSEIKKKLDESTADIVAFVLPQMRERFNSTSPEVLVQEDLDLSFPEFTFAVPQRGDKKSLLDLSERNTTYYQLEKRKKEKIVSPERHTERILAQIQKDFHLNELPVHMECFDNSNIQGTNPVSACVVFKNAKPSKADYRHFNVKTVVGPDDFATMEEAVYRRYRRMLEEEQTLPQLIIIDGGKGQLSAALKALDQLGLRHKVTIVGIAKKLEEIFFPGDQFPIYLDKRSESLKVIQHMRNEAHRFGITHHRNRRSKAALLSEILQIPGIGPKTQEALFKRFKTVQGIKEASTEALEQELGKAKTKIIQEYFASN